MIQALQRRPLLLMVGLGLLARLVVLFSYLAAHGGRVETWEYEVIARNLLDGKGYTLPDTAGTLHSFGSPLFPFISTLFHWVGGRENFVPYLIFQLALSLGLIGLIYRFTRRLFGETTALWASLLVALEPGLVLFGSYRVHEMTLVVFLTVATLELFVLLRERCHASLAVSLGLVIGLGFLARPTAIAFLPMLALWGILERRKKGTLPSVAVALVVAMLTVFPWVLRNYHVTGKWALLSQNWTESFWRGNNPLSTGSNLTQDGRVLLEAAPEELREKVLLSDEQERHRIFWQESHRTIAQQPLQFLRRCAQKFWYFWWFAPTYGLTYREIPDLAKRGYQFLYGGLLSTAVIGLFWAYRALPRQDRLILAYLVTFAIGLASLHALVYVEGRHKLVIMPFLLMFSAYGGGMLYSRFFTRGEAA